MPVRRNVSIHAPRAGRDIPLYLLNPLASVSIHAPRAGRDHVGTRWVRDGVFQSTRPARGATHSCRLSLTVPNVSIHAPRAGRDCLRFVAEGDKNVSIHAPRAGRDLITASCPSLRSCFNPRAPRGARPSRSSEWRCC